MAGLKRSSGPSGWTELNGTRFQLDGWELFEGDPGSPHQCQGWFACNQPEFEARKKTELHLVLDQWQEDPRELDVVITVNDRAEHLWEFKAK